MKKKNRINGQITLSAFALSLAALNATEQRATHMENLSLHLQEPVAVLAPSVVRLTKDDVINQLLQGVDAWDNWRVVQALREVNPDRYIEPFINTVKALTQGMDAHDKSYVIVTLGKVNPVRYTEPFINTVKALTQGMDAHDKLYVISALREVNPDRYIEPFINTVKALTQGMDAHDKSHVIVTLGKVNPVRYTEPNWYKKPFIKTVNALSQGMDLSYKTAVIEALGKVNPDRYTEPFIKTVNVLSQGMDQYYKQRVIDTLGKLNPDRYTESFINTVNVLSQGMDARNKTNVIGILGKVNPVRYKNFIKTVNELSRGMDASNKTNVIQAVGELNPDHYPFLQNFIRQNPQYFTYVPAFLFLRSITPNMTQQELKDMTQQQLQELLERLHRQYYRQAPAGTPQGLAFEIHTFANQEVVGETGEKQCFNQAVLNHIESSIEGDALDYNIVLGLLSSELATLQSNPLKSDAINKAVYNWVIEINEDPQDQKAIATVVTYLDQKDKTHGKLRTWLYAFMDESKKAYDGRNRKSCIMGVKERVITSLRSALPEGDSALENLFHQAEATLMIATKSKKLTDHAFWAEKLKQKGVTPSTPEPQAKDKFKEALVEFFAADKGAQEIIHATLDAFDDSEPYNASLRLPSGDGLWSKIKAELIKDEPEETKDRTCYSFFKKIALFFGCS